MFVGLHFVEYASCDSPYACAAAPILTRKWLPVIVCHLLQGPKRYGELRRAIPYISAKVLTENLEFMEQEQMLRREVRIAQPVEVWYHLTSRGSDLGAVIKAMNQWGEKWLKVASSESGEPGELGNNDTESSRKKKTSIPLQVRL
jgi:DNA-binding HxlR family transcriptional regulator